MAGLETLAIAVGLGADAMSVCIGIGVRWHGPGQKLRLAWHFGLFQALMPILGWLAGIQLAELIRGVGNYVAGALVFAVGLKMLWEAVRSRPGSVTTGTADWEQKHLHVKDPTRGWSLIGLSVAVGVAGLAMGFAFYRKGLGGIPAVLAERLRPLHTVLFNKYYVDELYRDVIVEPLKSISRFCYRVVDAIFIDLLAVNVSAYAVKAVGVVPRIFHNGNMQRYLFAIVLGLLGLWAVL